MMKFLVKGEMKKEGGDIATEFKRK